MAKPDLYGYNAEFSGIQLITAEEMILSVGSPGSEQNKTEYLVQSVSINYSQPIQLIREISTANVYHLALPPQGSISIARITGQKPITAIIGAPGTGVWVAPSSADDDQDNISRLIEFKPVGGKPGPTYSCYGCVAEGLSISTDANGSFVQESVQIRFGLMSVE